MEDGNLKQVRCRCKAGTLLATAAAALLIGCQATLPPAPPGAAATAVTEVDLGATYTELARSGGQVFALQPRESTVRMYAFRAGKAARLGHNHVLSAPQFIGFFYLPPSGAANGRFDLIFRLDQLEIDDPAERSQSGAAFPGTISAEDIDSTRQHLLGGNGMQADTYPFVLIHSLRIAGEAPKFAAEVEVQMHGRVQQTWVALDVDGLPDHLVAGGSFVLRQTDFGVQPYSLLGGLLSVEDEVVIEFRLAGTAL